MGVRYMTFTRCGVPYTDVLPPEKHAVIRRLLSMISVADSHGIKAGKVIEEYRVYLNGYRNAGKRVRARRAL
ncbi:MAG: hypothetical protein PHH57_07775 [Candidatus Omnitrophica bacterium]|nr:hypothetical protein [Candidatus Omnitrophota bacterium]